MKLVLRTEVAATVVT